ncbi:hypothetical protein ANCCAN_22442 [Ancylostoma caninum]|uniref:Uncharacterized protein n=1 Tax=Ancylostoma caninum TaxID=29170 RepID=A0A368FNK7_ANCCA|nr:hypothetical protein ANCCAN_22442 [Ancylostoma caninum]
MIMPGDSLSPHTTVNKARRLRRWGEWRRSYINLEGRAGASSSSPRSLVRCCFTFNILSVYSTQLSCATMNSPVSSGEGGASQRRSRYMRRKMTASNPYMDMSQENGFFTSTPYHGFHPVLPPISSIYSPLASYYTQYKSLSSYSTDSSTPSTSSVSEQSSADHSSPPPRLVAYSTSLSEDSGFLSTSSTAETTPVSRTAVRGYKKTYCMICKVNINKEGKRSQGPRRHLLQHHVRRPLFQCPHCSHSSFYDKFHVTSHMRRIHQDHSDRLINRSSEFEDEVDLWYQVKFNHYSRCFGEVGEAKAEQAIDSRDPR